MLDSYLSRNVTLPEDWTHNPGDPVYIQKRVILDDREWLDLILFICHVDSESERGSSSIALQGSVLAVAGAGEKPKKEGLVAHRKYTIRQKKRICVCSGGITAKSIEFTVSRPDKNSEKLGHLLSSDRSDLLLPGSPEPDYCLRVIL